MRNTLFSIVILILCISPMAYALSPPPAGTSDGNFEFALRWPVTSQNDSWKQGYRLGLNVGPFNASFEQGFWGSEGVRHFGFDLGFGGPLQRPPGWQQIQLFGRIHYLAFRWREERMIPYSGVEFGASRYINKNWGWFASVSAEYPGLLLVPTAALSSVREDIRNRDGLVTFCNIGLLFDPHGPNAVSPALN